jgi:integrase
LNRHYFTHARVAALADACGEYGTLIRFLAYSGCRYGEAAALRVKHVDVLKARVTIAESVTEVGGVSTFTLPKANKVRTISIPRSVSDLLAIELTGKAADDLVFQSARGGLLREGNWRRGVFNPAAVKAGVGRTITLADGRHRYVGATPHALRHTCASLAIANGEHVVAVSRLLGHASPNVTLSVYSHLFENDLDDLAGRFDDAITRDRGTFRGTNVVALDTERPSKRHKVV